MINSKGFTLIELLIIIGIISIITATVFVDYNSNSVYFSLERSAQKIGQDIRKAQKMSSSGIGSSTGSGINGYGLYFNSSIENAYTIYANKNEERYYNSGDDILEIIEFPEGIIIEEIRYNSAIVGNISTSFYAPGPITFIDSSSSGIEATIILKIEGQDYRKAIKINNSGAFEIYNP